MRTRGVILRNAIQLFSVKGFGETSVNDVIEAAGVTRSGLFGHFLDKEALWFAAYHRAVTTWRGSALKGLWEIKDPLARLERFIEQDMGYHLEADGRPDAGSFLLGMLANGNGNGNSEKMARRGLNGFGPVGDVIDPWLEEAERKGILEAGADPASVRDFIVASRNGAAALYARTKDPAIWRHSASQLKSYVRQLRRRNGRN